MKTKASLLSRSYHHIGGHPLKTFSLLVWDTSAKKKFVPNDHHNQQQFSTMESATFSPRRRLILCLLLYFSSKEASLFSLLLFCWSLLYHRYWLTALQSVVACCHGYRTMTQSRGCRGNLTGTSCFCVKETLTSVARSVQTTPVLFCVHSAAFASYLCVCMFVRLFSFHVRAVGVHTENGDTFANVN